MVILIQCPDSIGLVAKVASLLQDNGLNIVSMREHVDKAQGRFFARVQTEGEVYAARLHVSLAAALPEGADIRVNPSPEKRITVLVTKEYHCLSDILVRNHFGTLGATVCKVIGNHSVLGNICNRFGVPFVHLPTEGKTKEAFEEEILGWIEYDGPDWIVLAKFMRILSPSFVAKFPLRIINIHHSFLPAFVGANPYKQAFERGVKLIGATAHFVTDNLDEGPIIAQQINPVDHTHTTQDMVKAGKEIETAVLAKALRLVCDDKVFVFQNKTVVFE